MIEIKPLLEEDVSKFVAAHHAFFRETYQGIYPKEVFEVREQNQTKRTKHILERLHHPDYFYYALYDDWTIQGICIFSILDGVGILDALYLSSSYQKKGFGTKFLKIVEENFQKRGIPIYSVYVLKPLSANAFFRLKGGMFVGCEPISIHGKDYEECEYVMKVGEVL